MLECFNRIWVVDFEFGQRPGENPIPWCAVGLEVRSSEKRVWTCSDRDPRPVYTVGPQDLIVAYAAEAEGQCIRQLGWPMPKHCLDLLPLFRCSQNRFGSPCKAGLLDALRHFGLPSMHECTKAEFRSLAMRGAPFTAEEMNALVAYCEQDVEATARLLPKLCGVMSLVHALLMGRYTSRAVSAINSTGVPVNGPLLQSIVSHRDVLREKLIQKIDGQYRVFDGSSFRVHKFADYLAREGIPWPQTPTGSLELSDEVFKQQARLFPQIRPLRELRKTLATFRSVQCSIGADGRSRTPLLPFSSRTGRNQPRASGFVYSWPSWMRHLIVAPEGKALVVLDFEQQEFLIAAALSGDDNMLRAYQSGDPYLFTSKLAGVAPEHATKQSHQNVRETFKTAVLSMQYGCSEHGLAQKVGRPSLARELVKHHARIYRQYHAWAEQRVDSVLLGGALCSPFGWSIRAGSNPENLNVRSIANWSVQAAGSDILRVAAIALVEHGFEVATTVHDSLVVVADLGHELEVAAHAEKLMREASTVVLGGHECRVEAKVTRPSGNYCGEAEPSMMKFAKQALNKLTA